MDMTIDLTAYDSKTIDEIVVDIMMIIMEVTR